MAKEKLKIGIVGCGGIMLREHLPAYIHMADRVEIVALCDIAKGKAEEAKQYAREQYKSFILEQATVYDDFEAFIRDPRIESVDICTLNYMHSPLACRAFEMGKNVFCEKPDAISTADALKMKEASEKSGKVLMIMRNNRYEATSRKIKKLIEQGQLGSIYCGRCGWIRRRGIPGKGGWFTTKALSGGGALIDLGVHMIDLAMYFMGNPRPVSVSGSTFSNFFDNTMEASSIHASYGAKKENGVCDVEDSAMGFIKFDNGACLQIEFSWAANIEEDDKNFVELRGTKGGLKWEDSGSRAMIFGEAFNSLVNVDLSPKQRTSHGQEENIRHFIDVVLNGEKPDFVPEQGIDMLQILEAIYQSAETGKEIYLN